MKRSAEKENGRVYTPDFIVNDILDLSGYSDKTVLKKHVIDNSCGDGAFLCEIIKRYCTAALNSNMSLNELSNDLETYIHGIEIDKAECEKCIINMEHTAQNFGINGIKWDILCANTLTVTKYNGKMDYVLGNPPYIRVHNLGSSFEDTKKFSFAKDGMTDLFIVFYEIGLNMLNSTGILGYITPSSFFSSIAGSYMRKVLTDDRLIEKVVDLRHYQPFSATSYTTIVILKKNNNSPNIKYYRFDELSKKSVYIDSLNINDFFIGGNFCFAEKEDLKLLHRINSNLGKCGIEVKNGYATLCDSVFIGSFDFQSEYVIPIVKSSKGLMSKVFYPYRKNGALISEEELKKDKNLYDYLVSNKERLLKRTAEKDIYKYWYAFGRSQAINDTYKDKMTLNQLIRDEKDLKFVNAPSGVGVYGGLYITSDTIPLSEIRTALQSREFVKYVVLLGKYKSGGYYTFSSKDVKKYLDYKFAFERGLFDYE